MKTEQPASASKMTIIHSWKEEPQPKYEKFPDSFNQPPAFSSSQYIRDEDFDARCPEKIRSLASLHWTDTAIARLASKFLVTSANTKVLDIGSGVGKFCIAAAAYSNGSFTGVEQRENLCLIAKNLAEQYNLSNTKFIHANITQIDFGDYDAFYFYNSFHENMAQSGAIDYTIALDSGLYHTYTRYLVGELAKLPQGTRLVTYHGDHNIPASYELLYTDFFGALKFWRKSQ